MWVRIPLVPFRWWWGKLVLMALGNCVQQMTLAACQPFSVSFMLSHCEAEQKCYSEDKWMTVSLGVWLISKWLLSSSNLCHMLISTNVSQPASGWQIKPVFFLPNRAYPGNHCLSCSQCLNLWLQMATIAKPRIMHVCYIHWERRARLGGWLAADWSERKCRI